MARIEPFRAIRYTAGDLSSVLAPPYDILDEEDKADLLRKDDHNIVAIDLPHVPPKSAGPDESYRRAAGEMTSWLDIRALACDARAALYVYHQTYRLGARALTRKMWFARLRLAPLGQGEVFAHEETFGGPKEDRLMLTTATRCNVSPIFALYPDENNAVTERFAPRIDRPPDQSGMLDGVRNDLWIVTDPQAIEQVQQQMAERPVFIADGHHRYGTAQMYLEQQVEDIGEPSPDDPANFVLAVLCGMEDPGVTIQPYFRAIIPKRSAGADAIAAALEGHFDCRRTDLPSGDEALARQLSAAGPEAMALYLARPGRCLFVTPRRADVLADLAPDHHLAWRRSPYAILHRLVIDKILAEACGGAPTIHYHKTMQEAITDARDHDGIAALMPATTMQALRDICLAGELLPQKSTYFYPKLATGMVINPLYEPRA
jgi:uncharacterized protein (DUF1015 family)